MIQFGWAPASWRRNEGRAQVKERLRLARDTRYGQQSRVPTRPRALYPVQYLRSSQWQPVENQKESLLNLCDISLCNRLIFDWSMVIEEEKNISHVFDQAFFNQAFLGKGCLLNLIKSVDQVWDCLLGPLRYSVCHATQKKLYYHPGVTCSPWKNYCTAYLLFVSESLLATFFKCTWSCNWGFPEFQICVICVDSRNLCMENFHPADSQGWKFHCS